MTTIRKTFLNIVCAKIINGKRMLHAGSYVVFLLFFTASSCDKEPVPTGPSDEDLARCAHVIDNGFLHQVCLNNPWPTELPPATQEGLSTFGCWINDTLAFVANDPREPARKEAQFIKGTPASQLRSVFDTYDQISDVSIYLGLPLDVTENVFVNSSVDLTINGIPSLAGRYQVDSSSSKIVFTRLDNDVASGTFELTFYKPNTTDTIHLTDGRFDVLVSVF
jgi:hypothetical protein